MQQYNNYFNNDQCISDCYNFICRFAILRDRYSNCNADWSGRRNIFAPAGVYQRQQLELLILRPALRAHILSPIHSQMEHVAIQQRINNNKCITSCNNCLCGYPILCNGNSNSNADGSGRRNIHSSGGCFIQAATGAINLATSTPGHTQSHIHLNGTCSNTTTASITINALPTATISYAESPYCATGTATVTQTEQQVEHTRLRPVFQ